MIAFVTGGASGMGEAVCRLFAERGDQVIVADLDGARAKEVAATLDGASGYAVDVTDSAAVDELVDDVVSTHGGLDVVVTAAGVDDPETKVALSAQIDAGGPILRTPEIGDAAWRRLLAVNLDGTFFTLRAAARAMLPARRGAIVTIASGAAYEATPGYPHYVAAKAGVISLTHSVGKELIGHGIRVNGVAPGLVDTPMLGRAPGGVRVASGHPHKVVAQPGEIASVIAFLASDEAANIAGEVVIANGGRNTA
ncbi:SDR family oxidoreductase [Pseudonocardia halophobica]|uniref:Oxidoreductase n=1 Tax=Pseudonocardia halophobica TaxID=29401 RepID=A0A9W6L5G1_9PSEU|nr:SDR family NAD(P)-dependent oxidoreductase [Pseudonocardia halophobica]GLL13997.1 oxidoreductase [Pseudonocardia halophobica]